MLNSPPKYKVNFSTRSDMRTIYCIPVRLTSALKVTQELKCTSCYIVLIYVKLVAISVHKECRIVSKLPDDCVTKK